MPSCQKLKFCVHYILIGLYSAGEKNPALCVPDHKIQGKESFIEQLGGNKGPHEIIFIHPMLNSL